MALICRNISSRGYSVCIVVSGLVLGLTGPASAQDQTGADRIDFLAELQSCQALRDDAARLACFDEKVGAIVAARDAGDVRVVDREDLTRTRRQLFGFAAPKLDILGKDEDREQSSDLLATKITSVRYLNRKTIRFTTDEGAVWEINNAPARLAPINAGDPVVFKKAALNSFFIRINGQTGVKGRRIE